MTYRILLAAAALVATSAIAEAQQNLGGLQLEAYCRQTFGSNAHRIGPTIWDWRCGGRPFNVNDACRFQYGRGARAAHGPENDPFSWYCYR
ncbi:MAG TPA: hypothetical protein VK438_09810 [Xanthobacteraceae bacterium]|nr:hypothetical protein [Xanthobacteraceae bacterium]